MAWRRFKWRDYDQHAVKGTFSVTGTERYRLLVGQCLDSKEARASTPA